MIIFNILQVFQSLLLSHPHPDPLIILKGVGKEELENILEMIYTGKCQVLAARWL